MYLTSCERLAAKQTTLANVIKRIDEVFAQVGVGGDIDIAELAYSVGEQESVVENILDALVDLGGLESQTRYCCNNGCSSISTEEYDETVAEGNSPRCPECGGRIRNSSTNTKTVYRIIEQVSSSPTLLSHIPAGDALSDSGPHTLLFTAANPKVMQQLTIAEEWKVIETRIKQRQCKVEVQRSDRWAVSFRDLRQAILDHHPPIVHFSGHGTHLRGINFNDESGNPRPVTGNELAELFKLCNWIQAVVLNTCHSADQAGALAPYVHCVVCMSGEIDDDDAVEFSAAFYDALTAGEGLGRCFQFGASAIRNSFTSMDHPVLWLDGERYTLDA